MRQDAEATLVGVIGDLAASRPTRIATDEALGHAAASLSIQTNVVWIPTPDLVEDPAEKLAPFRGLVVAPGSPYASMEGALRGIRHARERGVPLLGTCGGFQHVVLEFARNVLGLKSLQHAEYEPDASELLIEPLECSLVGKQGRVHLEPKSLAALVYGSTGVVEEYRCSYGLAAGYEGLLEGAGLSVSGRDLAGAARVVELAEHPFYLATLFVPQLSSAPRAPHALIRAFLAAAAGEAP